MAVNVDPVTGNPVGMMTPQEKEDRENRRKTFVAEMQALKDSEAAKVMERFILKQLQDLMEDILQKHEGAKVLMKLLNDYGGKMNTAEYMAKQIYRRQTFQRTREKE